MKSVFVTVGTTCFDELIENITSSENVQVRSGDKRWCCYDFFLVVFFAQGVYVCVYYDLDSSEQRSLLSLFRWHCVINKVNVARVYDIHVEFLGPQILRSRGYERLILQVGRGSYFPATGSCPHISLEVFRFKDSIADDFKQADLVISHAGDRNIKYWTALLFLFLHIEIINHLLVIDNTNQSIK